MATTTISHECMRKGTRNSCHPTDATCERIGDRDVWLYRSVFCGPCMRRERDPFDAHVEHCIEEHRAAGAILLVVGMVCGLGIGLVLAWAVMS